LLASSVAWSLPGRTENRSIGENGREARKAAKQQQKGFEENCPETAQSGEEIPEGATEGCEASSRLVVQVLPISVPSTSRLCRLQSPGCGGDNHYMPNSQGMIRALPHSCPLAILSCMGLWSS